MSAVTDLLTQARSHLTAGRVREAEWLVKKLQGRDPLHPEVVAMTAMVEWAGGNPVQAVRRLQDAVRRNRKSAVLLEGLGVLYHHLEKREAAAGELHAALALDPNLRHATGILTQYAMEDLDWMVAIPLAMRLVCVAPDQSTSWNMMGSCHLAIGQLEDADAAFARSLALDASAQDAATNRSLNACYREDITPAQIFQLHRDAATTFRPAANPDPRPIGYRHDRIRIGYVSGDFRNHSVAVFIKSLLQNHDHERFAVYAYASVRSPDWVTAELRNYVDCWHDTRRMTDVEVAQQIRRDEIDLLIDLAGYTTETRLGIFALQPAPLLASWLGYPNTTGMEEVNFRFTDKWADPVRENDLAQSWHAEKLVRLPNHFFCYAGISPELIVDPSPTPVVASDAARFGVPTNVSKITTEMIRNWCKVLNAAPDSSIDIKALAADVSDVRERLLREFVSGGVREERVRLLGRSDFKSYCRLHDEWDVVLDTFPFNGHTTTCHALYLGVPVVTLAGEMHASRMGASILEGVGLPELIAGSSEDFVRIATTLAADADRLTTLRATLRQRMRESILMDGISFSRDFEATVLRLVRDNENMQSSISTDTETQHRRAQSL